MSKLDYELFFSSRRRHTRFDCDWSSDVCSSDLARAHGDLRARPGLAGDGHDLDLPVEDLRHLELEQPLDQALVGPAHDDLRAVDRPAHLEHQHLAGLADAGALM